MKKEILTVFKAMLNYIVYKAGAPVGTKRSRRNGIYEKQPDGSWKVVRPFDLSSKLFG